MSVLAMLLVMGTNEVFSGLRECQKANGQAIAVREQWTGRYGGNVKDDGVKYIECYLPNGSVRIYTRTPTPVDQRRTCASQGMNSVPDDRNPGQMKCVSKTPPSFIQDLNRSRNANKP